MLKILHTSDTHWNERSRIGDSAEMMRLMLQGAREHAVDLIVHAGDFFERRSCPTERTYLASWLQAAAAIAPVYGVRGNHDQPGDLEVFNRLETVNPIHIEDRVTAEPGSSWMVHVSGGRQIACLGMAWIDKAHLAAGLDPTVDAEASRDLAVTAVRDLLATLRAEATRARNQGAVPILVTHVMLGGSVVSSGQILIGQGIDLSPSDLLDVGAVYVACGHIHVSQEFFGGRVAYSGNPTRHDYGEANEPKGYRIVTLTDEGEFVSSEFIELPTRSMVLIECDWASGEGAVALSGGIDPNCFLLDHKREVAGALVRFRYRVRAQHLHLVDRDVIEKILLADGAHEVKVEAVVVSDTRVRSEEIATATSVTEKVQAYLQAKNIPVEPVQFDRLVEKLGGLETGAFEPVAEEVRS